MIERKLKPHHILLATDRMYSKRRFAGLCVDRGAQNRVTEVGQAKSRCANLGRPFKLCSSAETYWLCDNVSHYLGAL